MTVNALTSGRLPADANGQYFVLTSADVSETSGFCVYYCAWHGWAGPVSFPNVDKLITSFVGNPQQCPYACTAQPQLPTPNNNVGADGMVNSIAHELSESATDPFNDGWINNPNGDYSENGDLCVWMFGNYKQLPNGSYYNVKFGTRRYLTQQIWVNARGGYCALALDELYQTASRCGRFRKYGRTG